MIQYLSIKDLALIDQTTLEFEEGFTCITGETGAGKSVLLGALAMLSGNRLDRTIIRHGQDSCKVEAAIYIADPSKIDEKLSELDLPECEDGALLLSRSLHRTKVPKIQINGAMTTLTNLSEIGEYWIDFHGPGEPQKLFKEKFQLEILDLYSDCEEALHVYQKVYSDWKSTQKKLESIRLEKQLSEDEIHYLKEQIQKIDDLGVSQESLEDLEHQFQRISRSEELAQHLHTIQHELFEEGGAATRLSNGMQWGQAVEQIDDETSEIWARLDSLIIELDDLGTAIADYANSLELDPEAIESLKSRMETWMELKRKFGKTPEQVISARNEMAEKLETHGDIQSTVQKLEKEVDELLKEVKTRGEALTQLRKEGGHDLSQKVTENLKQLGFKKALFEIALFDEESPKEHGTSRCQMQFAPNPGQPILPLNKIASSGEIARVMLGIKSVLAAFDKTPVLVFDEVDANVGGEIGKAVGKQIASLSDRHQIFCVTHLPQVAALAQSHFLVQKSQTEDSTNVSIDSLDGDQESRVLELARMLGDRHSQSAIDHARELVAG